MNPKLDIPLIVPQEVDKLIKNLFNTEIVSKDIRENMKINKK